MGLDRTVRFANGATPRWEAIRDQLTRLGEVAPIRMIDGLPAFPDEVPEAEWKELRLGSASGMVTLRRSPDSLVCVVWGNADPALMQSFNRIIWACASAGSGTVDTPDGPVAADAFAQSAGLTIV